MKNLLNKIFPALVVAVFLATGVSAQKNADKKAVLAVPDKLFAAMEGSDPEGIRALFLPEARLFALIAQKEGPPRIVNFTAESFSTNFADSNRPVKEVMHSTKVDVDGDWATVWGRYVFFSDNKISHCGINQFNLFRTAEGWKISNATTTIDPNSCTKKEKAMKPSLK